MDTQRFDRITKQLATGLSRREAMKGVAVALGLSTVGSQTFEATARGKRCPSQNGSECPVNQICNNQTHICTKCDRKHFVTCKGSTGPGDCCYTENSHCCTCSFSGGATFGRCAGIGQSCSSLNQPEIGVVCT